MAPKKDAKKEPQQPPEQQQPQIPPHQLQGYGKFQYLDGTVYEGSWKLFDSIKMKHGQGIVTISGAFHSNLGGQMYEGSWQQDKMCGYGVYKYANGAFYRGDWKNNKHHGKGQYEFPNGTCYVGDWQDHLMHGEGYFIDENGRKWQGQFRKGKYESKQQKQLAKQRQLIVKKATMIKDIQSLIASMIDVVGKSDKKALKDNFGPFFPSGDVIKQQVKDPYTKFDEKAPQKWTQILNILKDGNINPLASIDESQYVGAQRILKPQLEGPGQVVQVISNKDQRCVKAAFVNVQDKVWVMCNVLDEEKKK